MVSLGARSFAVRDAVHEPDQLGGMLGAPSVDGRGISNPLAALILTLLRVDGAKLLEPSLSTGQLVEIAITCLEADLELIDSRGQASHQRVGLGLGPVLLQ